MAFTPSYRANNAAQLGNEIKCGSCNIVKNKAAYSAKRLAELSAHAAANPRFNPKVNQLVDCIGCTTRQVTELQCSQCERWKGLDAYSKAQRRERDDAKCWTCMQEQLDYEPASQYSSGDDASESDDSGAFYSGDEDVTSSYAPTASLATGTTGTRAPQAGGSVWTGKSATSVTGRTAISGRSGPTNVASTTAAKTTASSSIAARSFAKPPAGSKQPTKQGPASSDDDSD